MVYQASKKIGEALDAKDLNYVIEEHDHSSVVVSHLVGKNAKNLIIRFISSNDDNDVSVRFFAIADGSKGDKNKINALLNELNGKYRYICFYMADNGEINASYDVALSIGEDLGPVCCEILIRFWNIIDEAYPEIVAAAAPL